MIKIELISSNDVFPRQLLESLRRKKSIKHKQKWQEKHGKNNIIYKIIKGVLKLLSGEQASFIHLGMFILYVPFKATRVLHNVSDSEAMAIFLLETLTKVIVYLSKWNNYVS